MSDQNIETLLVLQNSWLAIIASALVGANKKDLARAANELNKANKAFNSGHLPGYELARRESKNV